MCKLSWLIVLGVLSISDSLYFLHTLSFGILCPKKVNLVVALVGCMLVKDALMQLELTIKRVAKIVYQAITLSVFYSHLIGQDCKYIVLISFIVPSWMHQSLIIFFLNIFSPPQLIYIFTLMFACYTILITVIYGFKW